MTNLNRVRFLSENENEEQSSFCKFLFSSTKTGTRKNENYKAKRNEDLTEASPDYCSKTVVETY